MLLQRKLYILFSVFSQIYFGIVYIWPTHHNFDLCCLWLFMLIYLVYEYFFPLKESWVMFQIRIFVVKLAYILSQVLLLWTELPKRTPTIPIENCDLAICLGLSILFLYAPTYMAWNFFKKIFWPRSFFT